MDEVNKRTIITGGALLLLGALAATGLIGWMHDHHKVKELQEQLTVMQAQELRATIDRSVSAQLEQIANEQRQISDEQREEALQQTRVANEMRLRSEQERLNAVVAERNALASEKKALEASAIAETERRIAEHQRIKAEMSKRTADTLSFIALGRSLGSMAAIQSQTGNKEVANMLSYAAYLFTSRYRGDVYFPAVFQSMIRASESMVSWAELTGATMGIEFLPGEVNRLVAVSNYGEIYLCERNGERLTSKTLFSDSRYDFRDVVIDSGTKTIYAVSRTGQLVSIRPPRQGEKAEDYQADVTEINMKGHPMRLYHMNDKDLIIIGEESLALYSKKQQAVTVVKPTPFRIICISRKQNLPIVFDDKGQMHLVKGLESFVSSKVPFSGKVTAYCESKNTGYEAYGMDDGTIWLADKKGRIQKLYGHQSRISKLKMNGRRLYSSSYDGQVTLWITDNEKVEPMTLIQTNNWITSFTFDSTKDTFWMGDIKGNLTAVNMSIPTMVSKIQKNLKRNLTMEEWNYFIGENVPYEAFVGKKL